MKKKQKKVEKLLQEQTLTTNLLDLKKEVSFRGLVPLLLFVMLFILVGIILDIFKKEIFSKNNPMGFYLIFAPIIILIPTIIGFLIIKGNFTTKLNAFLKGSADQNILIMVFIYLLSGSFAQLMNTIGASSAIRNIGFKVIPPAILVGGVFLISAVISTAMGTSVGTIVAFGPIAFGMASQANLNLAMIGGALLCGAMFGDDLSIISDTAIASCRTQDVTPQSRFLFNWKILLFAAIITIILFFTVTYVKDAKVNSETWIWWRALLTILPFLVVLVVALCGVNVFIVLISGIFCAIIVGFSLSQFNQWVTATGDLTSSYLPSLTPARMLNGNLNPTGHLLSGLDKFLVATDAIKSGMLSMAEIAFLALFTGGLAGLSELSGGLEWATAKINQRIKGKKSAQFGIATLTSVADIALANNTIAIIVVGPMVKEIRQKYDLNKNKVAAFVSIFPAVFQGLIPYGAQMLILVSMANNYVGVNQMTISFLDVWKYAWYLYLLFFSAIIFITFNRLERYLTASWWKGITKIFRKKQD